MKNKCTALLSLALIVAMAFSLLPMTAFAADLPEKDKLSQWTFEVLPQLKNTEETEEPEELPVLSILIATTDQKYAVTALAEDEQQGFLPVTEISAQGSPMFGKKNVFGFVVVDPTTVMIQDCYGRYLYVTEDYDGFYVSDQLPERGHLWSITSKQGITGKYLISTDTEKVLGYDSENGCFGAYAEETMWTPFFLYSVVPKPDLGDLNNDGSVDNKDVEYLLWYTLFPEDYPLNQEVDFNGDGAVDNLDVQYLLWHTLFPEDYPL